jgi:predicted protein tyrosine phosphatase
MAAVRPAEDEFEDHLRPDPGALFVPSESFSRPASKRRTKGGGKMSFDDSDAQGRRSPPVQLSSASVDTSAFVRRSLARRARGTAPSAMSAAGTSAFDELLAIEHQKATKSSLKRRESSRAAARSALVRVRAAHSGGAGKADDDARQRLEKLERLRDSVFPLRPMPATPPYSAVTCLCCSISCGRFNYERPSQVHANIFIGDMDDARSLSRLRSLGVTHILNMARSVPCYHEDSFIYTHIQIEDAESQPIRPYFVQAFSAMDEAAEHGTGILVHCVAGVSRSVTVVLAWLVERQGLTLREAARQVRSSRPIIDPNKAFRLALVEHELDTRGSSSVADGSDAFWDFHPWTTRRRSVRKDPPEVTVAKSSTIDRCLAWAFCLGHEHE